MDSGGDFGGGDFGGHHGDGGWDGGHHGDGHSHNWDFHHGSHGHSHDYDACYYFWTDFGDAGSAAEREKLSLKVFEAIKAKSKTLPKRADRKTFGEFCAQLEKEKLQPRISERCELSDAGVTAVIQKTLKELEVKNHPLESRGAYCAFMKELGAQMQVQPKNGDKRPLDDKEKEGLKERLVMHSVKACSKNENFKGLKKKAVKAAISRIYDDLGSDAERYKAIIREETANKENKKFTIDDVTSTQAGAFAVASGALGLHLLHARDKQEGQEKPKPENWKVVAGWLLMAAAIVGVGLCWRNRVSNRPSTIGLNLG